MEKIPMPEGISKNRERNDMTRRDFLLKASRMLALGAAAAITPKEVFSAAAEMEKLAKKEGSVDATKKFMRFLSENLQEIPPLDPIFRIREERVRGYAEVNNLDYFNETLKKDPGLVDPETLNSFFTLKKCLKYDAQDPELFSKTLKILTNRLLDMGYYLDLAGLPEDGEPIFVEGKMHRLRLGNIDGINKLFPEFVNEQMNIFYAQDSRFPHEGIHNPETDTTIVNVGRIKKRYAELVGKSHPRTKMWEDLSVETTVNYVAAHELAHYLLLDKYNFHGGTDINWTGCDRRNKSLRITSSQHANEFISDAVGFDAEPRVSSIFFVRRYVFRELSDRLEGYQKERGFVLSQDSGYDYSNEFLKEQLFNVYPQDELGKKFDVWAEEFKKLPIDADSLGNFINEKIINILSGIDQKDLSAMKTAYEQEALWMLDIIKGKSNKKS